MSDTSSGSLAPVPPQASPESSLRSMAMLAYFLLLVASISGLTAIAAVIIAYVKKRDSAGTVWESHIRNVILVFWVMLAAFLVGMLSFPISLGLLFAREWYWPLSAFSFPFFYWLLFFPILMVWFLYRVIRGLVRASESRAF